jgi:hypothetical protein
MPEDAIAHAIEEARVQTMTALREVLRTADITVLRKVAVDIVPELFRAGYTGEPGASGARWAHALAHPHAAGLPSFLVRIHSGPFSTDDAAHLRMTMEGAGIAQAALAILHEPPLDAAIRHSLGTLVPWLIDTDGLAHLMMNANVGVTVRAYEAKYVDGAYFRA